MNTSILRSSPVVTLPALPPRPRSRRRASSGVCLCGCGGRTGGRFVPGHDAKLLAWALVVEAGRLDVAPAPHTHAVAVEVALRAEVGFTGLAHKPALITADLARALADGEIPQVA